MKLYQSIVFAVFMVLKLQLADTKSAKIIGGTTAPQWKYAYMVSLQNYTEVTFLWQKYPVYQHFCAGTILPSKAKILTAAHCVAGITDFRNYSIYAGITNLQDTRGIRKLITKCTIETTYVAGNPGVGDIANCDVDTAFVTTTPTTNIATAVMETVATNPTNLTACTIMGWGSLSMVNLGTGYYSNDLMELTISALDNAACQRMWPKVTVNANHICTQQVAFNGNCFGDSGGPLICNGKQAGVIIAGNTICAVGQPDFYTRTQAFPTIAVP